MERCTYLNVKFRRSDDKCDVMDFWRCHKQAIHRLVLHIEGVGDRQELLCCEHRAVTVEDIAHGANLGVAVDVDNYLVPPKVSAKVWLKAGCWVYQVIVVEEYDPPPNPAKLTDSRAAGYIEIHGDESWELDALDPDTLDNLIREHVDGIRNDGLYGAAEASEAADRRVLEAISDRYDEVATMFGEDEE